MNTRLWPDHCSRIPLLPETRARSKRACTIRWRRRVREHKRGLFTTLSPPVSRIYAGTLYAFVIGQARSTNHKRETSTSLFIIRTGALVGFAAHEKSL